MTHHLYRQAGNIFSKHQCWSFCTLIRSRSKENGPTTFSLSFFVLIADEPDWWATWKCAYAIRTLFLQLFRLYPSYLWRLCQQRSLELKWKLIFHFELQHLINHTWQQISKWIWNKFSVSLSTKCVRNARQCQTEGKWRACSTFCF